MAPVAPHQYVTFNLMGEEYALGIHNVREIISFEPITAIPSMPPVVRGVLNLRGFVVPVIDLPVKFGLAATPLGPSAGTSLGPSAGTRRLEAALAAPRGACASWKR